jgi:hypothetical protein
MLDLFEKQSLTKSASGNSEMRTVVMKVSHYDLTGEEPLVIGTDLETGEEVSVSLRPAKGANADRTTNIRMLAGEVSSMKARWVRENGVLFFSSCYKGANGVYSAGYVQTLYHGDEPSEKVLLELVKQNQKASLDAGYMYIKSLGTMFTSIKNNKVTVGVEMMLLDDAHFKDLPEKHKPILGYKSKSEYRPFVAKSFDNFDHLKKYVEMILEKKNVTMGVIVRLKAEIGDKVALRTYIGNSGITYNKLLGELDTPENREKYADALKNKEIVLEVIPTLTVFASKAFLERLYTPNTVIPTPMANILKSAYELPSANNQFPTRLTTLTRLGLSIRDKSYNDKGELVDVDPYLGISIIEADYNADRYVGMGVASVYAKTSAIDFKDPDWIIENCTTDSLDKVKFTADSVRNANGISLEKREENSQGRLNDLSEANNAVDNDNANAKVAVENNTALEVDDLADDKIPF